MKPDSFCVKWKKVSGTDYYEIYVAAKDRLTYDEKSLKYEKVKTLEGGKTGYTLKKYKGAKIDAKKYTYYVRIVPRVKKGKKVWRSPELCSVYAHYYYKS